jgi:segregation and condensation protein A
MAEIQTLQQAVTSDYEVHIPVFEGPLALLLRLIEKNELDITKVALAQVTDEFMARVDEMRDSQQIGMIADFLAVAAKLLWIKSKALLPSPPASANLEDEEEDVGDELVRQLRTYRMFKEAAQWLRERDRLALRSYVGITRKPRPTEFNVDIGDATPETLRALAQAQLFPSDQPQPEDAIQRPRISIVQQTELIRRRLMRWSRVVFHRLFDADATRLEAVVTLQAVLELIKQSAVKVQQASLFGEIVIEALVPPEEIAVRRNGSEETEESS